MPGAMGCSPHCPPMAIRLIVSQKENFANFHHSSCPARFNPTHSLAYPGFLPHLQVLIKPAPHRASVGCRQVPMAFRPPGVRSLLRGPSHTTREKPLLRFGRGRHRPKETNPDNNPHTGGLPRSTGQISNIGLQVSFGGLTDRIANLFFLLVTGIITIRTAQNHRSRKARMAKLAMGAFVSRHGQKARFGKVGN